MNPGREHERPGPRSTRLAVDRPKNQHLDPDVDDVSENFRVLDEIGRGSYGVVYKAQDVKTKRYFAIKAVKECQGSSWSCLCKEGQILKTLQGHPNIVNLFCLLNADGDEQACPALVLEMCHCNLLDVFRNHREKIGIRHVKDLSLQLMEGLRHIHSCGIIHRDVKPNNLLFTWNGDLKIADFGLATFMRESHESKCYSPGVGTKNFKAPELLLGTTRYNRSVDMWAAGCTIVELMTNKRFFPGTSKQEILAQMVYLLGTIDHTTLPHRLDLALLKDFNLPQNDTIRMDYELSKYTSDVAAKNLVRALLQINPDSRLSASAAINHEFFICSPPPKRLVLFAADPLDQNNSGQDLLVPSGSDSSKGGVSQSVPTSAQTPLQDEPSVSSNYMSQRSTEQTNSEAGPLNQHSAGQDFLASSGSASSVRRVSRNISSSAQTLVQDEPQISSDYMSQRSTVQTNSEIGPIDQHSSGQDFLVSSGSARSVGGVSQKTSFSAQTPLQDEQQISGHFLSQRSTHSLSTVQTNSKASPIDQHSSGQDFLVSSGSAKSVGGVSQNTSSAQTPLQDEPPSSGHYNMSQQSTHSLSTVLSNNEAELASSPICISSEQESAYSDTNLMLQDYLQDSRSAPDVIVISSDTDMDVQPQHVPHPSGFPPTARDDTTQPQPQAASHASGLLTAADINANQQQFQVFPPPGYPQLSIPHQQMSHLTQGGNMAYHATQPYQQCQCTFPGHLPGISVMLNHHPNYPYLQQCHNPQPTMQPGRSCQGQCFCNTIDPFPHPY